jgi:hypothetical protein
MSGTSLVQDGDHAGRCDRAANKALEGARSLGMTVMLCPSDVVDNYVGFPQRETVLALPQFYVPALVSVNCPSRRCGWLRLRPRAVRGELWLGRHAPGLKIANSDLMPDTQAEVYAICKKNGLPHLIYVGFTHRFACSASPWGLRR